MRWIRHVSLRLQIILLVLTFTLAVGVGNTLRTQLALDSLAREQFERRSVATAAALAALATDPVLADDLFGLYELINDTQVSDPDVRYVLVLDVGGDVRAHTFGPSLPRGLAQANDVAADQRWHVRRLRTEEGTIMDVAMPLAESGAGTLRVGMSEQAISSVVRRHTLNLLALTAVSLLPVLAVTYVLGRALTQPLLELVEVSRAIGRGDLGRRASVAGLDEVAQLGAALNAMARDLERSKEALEASNRKLQERNEELSALYAVATATAQAESIDSLVEAALDRALDVLDLQAGWVLLHDNEVDGGWVLSATKGLEHEAARQMAGGHPQVCVTGEPGDLHEAVIAHAGAACPWLAACSDGREATCHAVVPLRSRTHTWGIMNLGCPDPTCLSADRLGLLTAVGRQVGVAIENARLAASQRQETFGRLLLDRVMTAQEDERKRIARELHDEMAQNLTALIRYLERVAVRAPSDEAPLQEAIAVTRDLAQRILQQTRRLVFDLRPTALDDLGLLPAIRRHAQHHLDMADIRLRMEVLGQARRLLPEVETAVFRIAQEAITNIVRHARASCVHIVLRFEPSGVALTVADDGQGFEPSVVLGESGGTRYLGLLGMRERAELLGGHLDVESRPEAGTSIIVEIPWEEHGPDTHRVGG